MTALRGVTMVYTEGRPISTGFSDGADHFAWLGTGYLFGLPVPIWLMAIVFLLAWFMLNHTRLGRYIYALGGNESATRLRHQCGPGEARGVWSVRHAVGTGRAHRHFPPLLRPADRRHGLRAGRHRRRGAGWHQPDGGKGRIMGTLIGALIIGFLNNALNLLDVSSYYQMIAKASVILLAVMIDNKSK